MVKLQNILNAPCVVLLNATLPQALGHR